MKPILFYLFGIPIFGYGTMIAIGICAALLLVNHRAKRRGYDEDSILNMSILAIILGVIGGKLLYLIIDIKAIIADTSLLLDFGSGFVIYGAIIGGALGVYIYCRRKKWNVFNVFDTVIPAIPLAQGFGRIGCFLAGCCYGKPTNMTIGVEFTISDYAPLGEHLHPTQIYSSVFDFFLAFFLLWYARKERKSGRVFSMYIILYSIGRFLIEFLRDDPRGSVGPLSTSQFISIFTLILGAVFFNAAKLKKSHKEEPAAEVSEYISEEPLEETDEEEKTEVSCQEKEDEEQ